MLDVQRRKFLLQGMRSTMALAGTQLLQPFLLTKAFAKTLGSQDPSQGPQYFLLIRIAAGWDTSLAMDPWTSADLPDPKDFFIEYTHSDLLKSAQGRFFGPAMAPLSTFFDQMTIINGVFMSAADSGHPAASLYSVTGNGQGTLGALNIQLEGPTTQSPFGILSNASVPFADILQPTLGIEDIKFKHGFPGGSMFSLNPGESTELEVAKVNLMNNSDRMKVATDLLKQFSFGWPSDCSDFQVGLKSELLYGF